MGCDTQRSTATCASSATCTATRVRMCSGRLSPILRRPRPPPACSGARRHKLPPLRLAAAISLCISSQDVDRALELMEEMAARNVERKCGPVLRSVHAHPLPRSTARTALPRHMRLAGRRVKARSGWVSDRCARSPSQRALVHGAHERGHQVRPPGAGAGGVQWHAPAGLPAQRGALWERAAVGGTGMHEGGCAGRFLPGASAETS
jgi:hypothetical protein